MTTKAINKIMRCLKSVSPVGIDDIHSHSFVARLSVRLSSHLTFLNRGRSLLCSKWHPTSQFPTGVVIARAVIVWAYMIAMPHLDPRAKNQQQGFGTVTHLWKNLPKSWILTQHYWGPRKTSPLASRLRLDPQKDTKSAAWTIQLMVAFSPTFG